MTGVVDLNADCGEGPGVTDDEGLLGVVTSASVACGGHAGTPASLAAVVGLAADRGVAVGAQVSFVDREGFGRRPLPTPPEQLRAELLMQAGGLDALCRAVGTRVRYLKPHGALYHVTLAGGPQAEAVAAAAAALGLPLLLMPGSPFPAVSEGFADRGYDATPTGPRLRARGRPGALLTDPERAAGQAVSLAEQGLRSLCVHGDSPGAVATARAVRAALEAAGWTLAAFA